MGIRFAVMLVLAVALLGGPQEASAQVWSSQIQPSFLSNGPCPTTMGNINLPAQGFICWRTDTFTFYVYGNGAWNQALLGNAAGTNPTLLTALTVSNQINANRLLLNSGSLSYQVLAQDLVLAASDSTVAPTGPGQAGALALRARKIGPGRCALMLAGGTKFGEVEVAVFDTLGRTVQGGFACQ